MTTKYLLILALLLSTASAQPPLLTTSGTAQPATITAATTDPTTPDLVGTMVLVRFTTPTVWASSRSTVGDPALGYPPISADSVGYFVAGTKEWVCLARTKTIWEGRGVYSDLYTVPRSTIQTSAALSTGIKLDLPVTRP